MSKIRVLLKSQDKYVCAYWFKRQKSSIVGWMNSQLISMFPTDLEFDDVDAHYTYPADGDFHISYKYRKNGELVRVDVVTRETIKQREYLNNTVSKETIFIRDSTSETPYSFFVPTFKLPSLSAFSECPAIFVFPTFGFGIAENSTWLMKFSNLGKQPNKKDLIIDLNHLDGESVNIIPALIGAGNAGLSQSPKAFWAYRDTRALPYIEINVLT